MVICETWVASLQDKNYPEAKRFIPERWLDADKVNHHPFLAIPFGVGRRMCPGKRIAEHEMLIITAKVKFASTFYDIRISYISLIFATTNF